MKDSKVGIVIPFTNLSWLTINCLKSIEASTKNIDYTIYLMNNGSSIFQTEKILTYLHATKLEYYHTVFSKNNGFVKATNIGIKKALKDDCTHIVMLNNDTIVTDEWLQRMLEVMKNDVGMVGVMSSPPNWRESVMGKALIEDQPDYKKVKPSMEGFAHHLRNNLQGITKKLDFIPFFCALVKKELIDEVGLLSEDYGVGLFDDDDYCHRVRKTKWKMILAKEVYVHHFHNSTFISENLDYMKILEENRKVFEKKYKYDPWNREEIKQ